MTDILQLDRAPIYPPTNGRSMRVWRTCQKFSDSADVWLATPQLSDDTPEFDGIQLVKTGNPFLQHKLSSIYGWNASMFIASSNPFDWAQAEFTICAVTDQDMTYDLVVSESPQCIRPAVKVAKSHDAPLLLNKHNAYYQIVDQFLESFLLPHFVKQRVVRNIYKFEQRWINFADAVVFQSIKDRDAFDIPSDTQIETIPNGTDVELIQKRGNSTQVASDIGISPRSVVCIFLGSYDYHPNQIAAETIIEKIAPSLPEVAFLLVGRNPPQTDQDNVYTPGYVDDLPGALSLADIALCPLQEGSGTKLKMMDYLAAGLPIVTSQIGASGINLIDEETALIRESSEEFVEAIRRLNDSPSLVRHLSQNAEEMGERYGWKSLLADYDELLAKIL